MILTTQNLREFRLSQRCCLRFRSSRSDVPEHVHLQNRISGAVILCSGLYLVYLEIFVLTVCIIVGVRTPVCCSVGSRIAPSV